MQIKKDEVRDRLLGAGCREFLVKGFDKASVRSIVAAAHTTIGNFYNYFDSKTELFSALVEGVHAQFTHMIENHHNIAGRDELLDIRNIYIWRQRFGEIIKQLIPIFDERFVLLVAKSQGTKYADTKQQFVKVVSEHFNEHIGEFAPDYPHPEIGRIVGLQFVDGLIAIIESTQNHAKKENLIIEQILFTSAGIFSLLQGGKND